MRSLKVILVQAAWAASRTKNTFLSSKYRRMAPRIGKKKALIALARTMLVSIYHMIKERVPYKELGDSYIDKQRKNKLLKHLKKRIEALGCSVEVKELAKKTA